MSVPAKLPLNVLENALSDTIAGCKGAAFSLEDVCSRLPAGLPEGDRERLKRMLDAEETLFSTEEGVFRSREDFFRGTLWCITPDQREIDRGILIPGHRLVPVLSPEIFPSEAVLTGEGAAAPFARKEITEEVEKIFSCHLLLGSEQLSDFLRAEHPDNCAKGGALKHKVRLNVWDLKDFYERHDFQLGDALICRVDSWAEGRCTVQYRSGADRPGKGVDAWSDDLCDALKKVIARFESYLEMPEQLSWAVFLGAESLRQGAGSLDEFIVRSHDLEIRFEAGYSCFGIKEDEDVPPEEAAVPEGVSVSRGTTDNLGVLLSESGSPLTEVEIDSYILDAAYARELDYETFYARAFGRDLLHFSDEAQEAVFLNHVEDRWEDLTEHYDRATDEPKAELRTQILEILDERNEFLDLLRSSVDHEKLAASPELRDAAAISARFDALLKLLNAEDHTLTESEAESLSEAIGSLGDAQRDLFEKIQPNPEKNGEDHA